MRNTAKQSSEDAHDIMKYRKSIDQPAKAKTGGQHRECEAANQTKNMRNIEEKAEIGDRSS